MALFSFAIFLLLFRDWVTLECLHYIPLLLTLLSYLENRNRAFLAAEWWRVRLAMWETCIQSLVKGDSTSHGAAGHMLTCHNYWACVLRPGSCNYWSLCWAAREAQAWQLASSPCSPKLEKSPRSNEDPAQPKIKKRKRETIFKKKMELITLPQNYGKNLMRWHVYIKHRGDLPGGPVVQNPPVNAGD